MRCAKSPGGYPGLALLRAPETPPVAQTTYTPSASSEKAHEATPSPSISAARRASSHCGPGAGSHGLAFEQRLGPAFRRCKFTATRAAPRLHDLFEGKPSVLVLGYFHCPNLCGIVRSYFEGARQVGIGGRSRLLLRRDQHRSLRDKLGRGSRQAEDCSAFRHRRGRALAFPHRIGDGEKALADAVGFRARPEPERNSFAHPVGSFSPHRKASYRAICRALITRLTMFGSLTRSKTAISRPPRHPCYCALIMIRPLETHTCHHEAFALGGSEHGRTSPLCSSLPFAGRGAYEVLALPRNNPRGGG